MMLERNGNFFAQPFQYIYIYGIIIHKGNRFAEQQYWVLGRGFFCDD